MNYPQNQPQSPSYQKQITIANIGSKLISPRPGGKMFNPFTIHQMTGNDGIIYETTNQDWASKRTVGETVNVSYYIETRVGANNQVQSNYKLVLPRSVNNSNQIVIEGMTKIYARIEQMEKNILARIDLLGLPSEVYSPELSANTEGDTRTNEMMQATYETAGTITPTKSNNLPVIQTEEEDLVPEKLPF